ncbi:hypothetical protein ACFQGF_17015 [Microbulbifer taiwanensis]
MMENVCEQQNELLLCGTVYQADTDGFVVVRLQASGKEQLNANGAAGSSSDSLQSRASASVHRDTAGSNTVAVDENSFTMPVRTGEYWRVSTSQDCDASGNPGQAAVSVSWMPFGR